MTFANTLSSSLLFDLLLSRNVFWSALSFILIFYNQPTIVNLQITVFPFNLRTTINFIIIQLIITRRSYFIYFVIFFWTWLSSLTNSLSLISNQLSFLSIFINNFIFIIIQTTIIDSITWIRFLILFHLEKTIIFLVKKCFF